MIDIENKIVDILEDALNIKVTTEFNWADTASPVCYVRTLQNSTYEGSLDESLREHHAVVEMRLELYSNSSKGARSELKAILNKADETMQDLKFKRTGYGFIPNIDRSWTRMYADYEVIVGEGKDVDGTIVHRMYRRS